MVLKQGLALQTPGQLNHNAPVVHAKAWCGHCLSYAGDAALAVGDRAVFFTPSGGWQDQVGKGHRGGVHEGFLQHHELTALERAPDRLLIGHGLSRIGASNPQGFDLAVSRRLEHLHCGFAWLGGDRFHAPKSRHLRTVLWVGQVTVCAEQIGESPNLAASHGVGLTG